ncbi:MAG: GEVED domain-containing protein [Chitinophagales bacterium]
MKSISKILIMVGVFFSTSAFADVSLDWLRTVNGHQETGASIARDTFNNTYTLGSGAGILYLVKRDVFGNKLWEVSHASSNPSYGQIAVKVFSDPQGNPIVVAFQYSGLEEGPNNVALVILKYSKDGVFIYEQDIPGSYTYFNNSSNRTKVTAQMDETGNVYIATAGLIAGNAFDGFNVIKLSPSGSILWQRTEEFTNNSNFFFVNNLRVQGNRVGLTGSTLYWLANATSWVLDTAGNAKWTAITPGIGGVDIVFDNLNKAYVLTELFNAIANNSGNDYTLYKYSAAGVQKYVKSYDFGGYEIPVKMERSQAGNLVVTGNGNKSAQGIFYSDWVTAQFKPGGNLMWMTRYDATVNNDEIPRDLTIDTSNNIFITGTGGPYPGGSNLGALQMVTVKYKKNGVQQWVALQDTIATDGVDVLLATNGSIFVLGAAQSTEIHYLDNTGSAPCSVPVNVTATSITEASATISWTPVQNAYLYHVQYKTSTSSQWNTFSTGQTSFSISDLFAGTTYDFRVEAICNSGPTGYSSTQQFTTLGTGYCTSMGLDVSKEWIDEVFLQEISNSTGKNGGYGDFTSLTANLKQGATYSITLSADMSGGTYTQGWQVWIDYNDDGDFDEANERVIKFSSSTLGWSIKSFTVPSTATLGTTRMRVSMKNGTYATPCETFARGEVEDYSINILAPRLSTESDVIKAGDLNLYPNPATSDATLNLNNWKGAVTVEVYDAIGNRILFNKAGEINEMKIAVNDWKAGMYFIRVSDLFGNIRSLKFIKQ